jgi:hypothetical protein
MSVWVCVCVCVRERERERVCVCLCVRHTGRHEGVTDLLSASKHGQE